MNYELLFPGRIVFGWGMRARVADWAKRLGGRVFLVTGSRTLEQAGVFDEIRNQLTDAGLITHCLPIVQREPECIDVDRAVQSVQQMRGSDSSQGDLVVAIGGGAAIDLGKAVAALVENALWPAQQVSVRDFLEGVGTGKTIERPPLPLIALPTTAGTGAEATKNAVISSVDPPFKKSLRSDRMLPTVAIIDPELTVSNPQSVTAAAGMDAVTQLIESAVTLKTNAFTQSFCWEGLRHARWALREAYDCPTSRPAREAMAHAALLSGLALANSGLGLAHGVAAALGIHCGIPHGLACATLLPVAVRENLPVRRSEFAAIGRILVDRPDLIEAVAADEALRWIEETAAHLQIPRRLRDLGVRQEQLPDIARDSRGNSLSGNPRSISPEELSRILQEVW